MPITRRQFELGISNEMKGWMEKLYALLEQNQESAFTRDELGEALEAGGAFENFEHDTDTLFDEAISKLIRLNCVDARNLNGMTYFAKGQRELDQVLPSEALPFSFGLR